MFRQGVEGSVAGERERGGGLNQNMSSFRGRSRQMLICGNVRVLASHFVVQKHVPST